MKSSSAYALKHRYGITEHHVVELAAFQGEVCAICGDPPDMSRKRGGLHVDHDHTTGVVRGLLCEPCNLGLGFFRDNPERLLSAMAYLKDPPATKVPFTDPLPKPSDERGRRNPVKQAKVELVCKHCGKPFFRKAQTEYQSRAKGKEGPFCGRKCSGAWSQSQQAVQGLIHGTTNGYTYYKCRCADCKKAHTEAERARRKRVKTRSVYGKLVKVEP